MWRITPRMLLSIVLLASAGAASATTLSVDCAGHRGLTSISAAVKLLAHAEHSGPNTINVSGTCTENVVIQSMSRLTLNGVNGATIVDASGGATATVLIDHATDINVNNFIIKGTPTGTSDWDVVDCENGSTCWFTNDTVQDGTQGAGGIGSWAGSYLRMTGGIVQNNTAWAGIIAGNGGTTVAVNVTSQGNWNGAIGYNNGYLQLNGTVITANGGDGIVVGPSGRLLCNACTVSTNGVTTGSNGISASDGSSVHLAGAFSVTGNGAAGVSLTNLSSLVMNGPGSVTGNLGSADVICKANYTTATGLTGHASRSSGCP